MARLLFATGKRLHQISHADFDALTTAGMARQERTGRTWRHYRGSSTATKTVLFHMGVLPTLPETFEQRWPFTKGMTDVPEPMHSLLVRYLQAKSVTCRPNTVSGIATRLAHFGRIIAAIDPEATPATMDRIHHVEPRPVTLANTKNFRTGRCLSRTEQARRILAVANFLSDMTEWDWPQAPARRLLFSADNPRLPEPLPRFLPPDADRRLIEELQASSNRLPAGALLLQRACGLRIGELLDLELDAVIDIPANGSWLKIPWASSTPNAWSPSTRRSSP